MEPERDTLPLVGGGQGRTAEAVTECAVITAIFMTWIVVILGLLFIADLLM